MPTLLMLWLVLLPFARDAEPTAGASGVASDARELAEAARRPDAARDPSWLRASAERVGELLARARDAGAGVQDLRTLAVAGEALAERVETARTELVDAAGEDEVALEAQLRSEDWQRVRYAAATLEHWNAWIRLELAVRLPTGSAERRALAERAATAFARSTRSLAVPGLSSASLLGAGLARLETGDLDASQAALEDLETRIDHGEASEALRGPLLRGLVRLHARRGDLARARQALSRVRADDLGSEELRLGRVVDLLEAEQALTERRYDEARTRYAVTLDDLGSDEGRASDLDVRAARHGYAVSLYETGRLEEAARQLGLVLEDPSQEAARDASVLRYAIAEALLRDADTPEHRALAASAAEQVLRHAPDAELAGNARLRVALERESARQPGQALDALARVDPASAAYPQALWNRIRLRAARIESGAPQAAASDRAEAARLADDIDEVLRLAREGRVPLEGGDSATLSILRARAAQGAGAPAAEVRAWIGRARSEPGKDAEGRRALLGVELRLLADTSDAAGFSSLLATLDDATLRREFPLVFGTLLDLEEHGASAALRAAAYTRLARCAPPDDAPGVELGLAQALLDGGDAGEAVRRAQELVRADSTWGDAWRVLASALEADGDVRQAASAWRTLSEGAERGSAQRREAQLGLLRVLQHLRDAPAACDVARELAGEGASLDVGARSQVDRALAACAPQGPP